MGCGQVDTIEVGYYHSYLRMWQGQGHLHGRGFSLYPDCTLAWEWLMCQGTGHRIKEPRGCCWSRWHTTLSGVELVGETCECSSIEVPPPVVCPLPRRCSSSLLLSVSPPLSEREVLATRRGVEMRVAATSSSMVPAMNLGGVSVSSRHPCTRVWIMPLLTNI